MGIQKHSSFIKFCLDSSGLTKYYRDQVPTSFTTKSLYSSTPITMGVAGAGGLSLREVMATVTFFAPTRLAAETDAEKVLLALQRAGNRVPLLSEAGAVIGKFVVSEPNLRSIPNPVDAVGAVTLTVMWQETIEHIDQRGPILQRSTSYLV
ncbi:MULTISPECIES: hypothetical protein [Exiguobacterium]|uniref:hypothetical protein n=1 Tax=Exiguobacterium TaxID=33986 RepID=UPI001AEA3F8C|nr:MULTISPECIES: hypothetical protein [Exiguobacterium]MCT4779826.1 hypothetical protein [Exiguobacterium soli]